MMTLITRPSGVTWGGHVGAGLGSPVCCKLKMWHLKCMGCSIRQLCRLCYCTEVRHGVCLCRAWNVWRVSTFAPCGECQAKGLYGKRMGPGRTHTQRMCFRQSVWNRLLTMWTCGDRPSRILSSIGWSMKICAGAVRKRGLPVQLFWWDQPMDLDLAWERGLWPHPNQGKGPVVIENNKDYERDGL